MKKIYKIEALILIIFGLLTSAKAQNYTAISQYMYQQSLFNPAAMGSYNDISGALLIRDQWVGVEGAPRLYAFNGAFPFENMNLGLSLFHKEIGAQKETSLYIPYSYRLKLNQTHYLSFGISAGGVMHNRDYRSLSITNPNDPIFAENVDTKFSPNFQLGTYLFSKKYYIGLYSPGMLRNNVILEDGKVRTTVDFDKRYLHLFLQGGYEFDLNREMKLNLSSLVKYTTYAPLETDINAMLNFRDWVGIGVSYRTNRELLGLLKLRLSRELQLAYAYQHTSIKRENFQSHEIMLLFNFDSRRRRLIIQSPRF